MKVTLLAHTPMPEHLIASAAKICYSPSTIDDLRDDLSDEKAKDFISMIAEVGHESPIEHASFTFGIEGVSRALLAQITRHRMASFSVQSQRYVKEKMFEYVIPSEIENIPEAKEKYINAMEADQQAYEELANILKEKHFKEYLAEGMAEKKANRTAEKKAIEDARFVLPNACTTKMIMTMNARSLQNFFSLRCCNRAQWEIRELAEAMLRLCLKAAPELFKKAGPGCTKANCPEGKMTCGKIKEVREKYKKIRENP